MAGVLWVLGVGVAAVATGRATSRWAAERCADALAGAHRIPAPSERSFVLIAGLEDAPVDRALVREQRAFQQALDSERRGGTFLARRATLTVPSDRR